MSTSQGAPEAGATELLPCPFCGSADIRHGTHKDDFENDRFEVNCYDCGIGIGWFIEAQPWGNDLEAKKAETIADWNRRAASPSPPPGVGGWQDMSTAPKDGTAVIVAVPDRDRTGYYVGEAYFNQHSSEEGDWWWAGTSNDEYFHSSITEGNHHLPELWQPMPAEPGSVLVDPPVGVEVVKLEWRPYTHGTMHTTDTILGEYRAWEIGEGYFWREPWAGGRMVEGGLEAAKAAAQADFETRIRSALVPSSLLKEAGDVVRKLLACPLLADGEQNDPTWGCEETAEAEREARAFLARLGAAP